MSTTTTASVLSLDNLFKSSRKTAVEALEGRFEQLIVSTKDYALSLVITVSKEEDRMFDAPASQVSYEVLDHATDHVSVFEDKSLEQAIEFANKLTREKYDMQKVIINLAVISRDQYSYIKPSLIGHKIRFDNIDVTVHEINNTDSPCPVGFVKTTDVEKLHAINAIYRPE